MGRKRSNLTLNTLSTTDSRKLNKKEKDGQYDDDGHMQGIDEKEEIKSDTEHTEHTEEIKSDTQKQEKEHYDPTLIIVERRDYTQQRMMMQTLRPEVETDTNKIFDNKIVSWLIFYFRRHPFLPGLIILIIQAVVEVIILYDVVSDIRLAVELFNEGWYFTFMVSWLFINAPYVIAWTAASSMNAKKLKQNDNNILQIIGCMLFNIAPIGILFLLLVDIYHLIECVAIKPIFYLIT